MIAGRGDYNSTYSDSRADYSGTYSDRRGDYSTTFGDSTAGYSSTYTGGLKNCIVLVVFFSRSDQPCCCSAVAAHTRSCVGAADGQNEDRFERVTTVIMSRDARAGRAKLMKITSRCDSAHNSAALS